MKYNHVEKTAEVCKLFNDCFDIFNSYSKYGKTICQNAYRVSINEQNAILENMTSFIQDMRVGSNKALLPFQKDILICNKSLPDMLQYLSEKYKSEYIITKRINQDVLENFFVKIRGMGGTNIHPTPMEFKQRSRKYILGENSLYVISTGENTIGDENSTLLINLQDLQDEND